MANEISVASMLSDGVLSAFIVSDFQARNTRPDDLRAALERVEWRANSGSPSQRTALFDDDFTFTAAASEISGGVSDADPDWGYFQLTAARRLLPLTLTDLEAGVRGPNGPDPALVAGMIVRAAGKTITDMACAVAAAATEEVGDGLGPMTVDLWMDAKTQLEETATPPPTTACSPRRLTVSLSRACAVRPEPSRGNPPSPRLWRPRAAPSRATSPGSACG